LKVYLPSCILVGCQQGSAYHDMMLRAMYMTERQGHHLLDDMDRVFRCLFEAKANNGVKPCGMAVVADIMAFNATSLAILFFMADGTLHQFIDFQIFQLRLAYQTFLFHELRLVVIY
jgi:hypothetical protein